MNRWIIRCLLALIVAAVVIWVWRTFFPSPERVIRKNLLELAQAVSVAPNEAPLAQFANAARVTSFFTADAQVIVDVPGYSRMTLSGMEELRPAALRARQSLTSLRVEFVDIAVNLPRPKPVATAEVMARAFLPGERDFQVQELKFTFTRVGRKWLIRRVETAKTLL